MRLSLSAFRRFALLALLWVVSAQGAADQLLPRLVRDIFPGANGSAPNNLTSGYDAQDPDVLYFTADDGVHGVELWRSDGTLDGTVLVKDIVPGPGSSGPGGLVFTAGRVFFSANDGVNGSELWVSDGTAAGTVMVKDIRPGAGGSTPGNFLAAVTSAPYGTVYFDADDGLAGYELWRSDGTAAGTVLVKDIRPQGHSNPWYMIELGAALFFSAEDGSSGRELWKSDGTAAGTVRVRDILPGSGSSHPAAFARSNSNLLFTASDGVHGYELWKTDGTAAGTVMVADIHPAGSSTPSEKVVVGGRVYFPADDGATGREMWSSDGTAAGTVRVLDLNPAGSSNPQRPAVLGSAIFFRANDGTNGEELWRLFSQTVTRLTDNPGAASSLPSHVVRAGYGVYFSAQDGVSGFELWRSDVGGATARLRDLVPGPGSSFPQRLTWTGRLLFASLEAPGLGQELWALDVYPKGDLNHDGQTDLVLRRGDTGQTQAWWMNGTTRGGVRDMALGPAAASWRVAGLADLVRDSGSYDDLLLWDPASGQAYTLRLAGFLPQGAPRALGGAAPLPPTWQPAATADFDHDRVPDIVWRDTATQGLVIWTLARDSQGASKRGQIVPSPSQAVDGNWEVVAALDFDDDGNTDLLWYNNSSGRIVQWLMDAGVQRLTGRFTNPAAAGDANWRVVAAGDYGVGSGGWLGTNDVVWRNATSGRLVVWHLDFAGNRTGGGFTTPMEPSPDPTAWTVVGPR